MTGVRMTDGTPSRGSARRLSPGLLAAGMALLFASPLLAAEGEQAAQGKSWFQMFLWSEDNLGLIVIWALIAMSVTVVAMIIYFLLENRSEVVMPTDRVEAMEQSLSARRFSEAISNANEDASIFGQLMAASLGEASRGYAAMERAIEETADIANARKGRAIAKLDILGQIGPMLGLFGTVYGMITAFEQIVQAGGQPKPAQLAAGISTALVTTFWGLVVGIPAIAGAALLRNRAEALTTEATLRVQHLIGQLRPGRASSGQGQQQSSAPKQTATSAAASSE